nr:hypothetical protein [Neorhizobium sp. T7_12]
MSDRKYPQLAWSHWYAWYPVLPVDDSIHWLEAVYRRKDEAGRWVYRKRCCLRTLTTPERTYSSADN